MESNRHSVQYKVDLLLIEDDPFLRECLSTSFQRKGYRVRAFESAEDAMEILKDQCCDTILCDYNLPGMNGIQFLGRVSEVRPDVVRILMTGCGSPNVCQEAQEAGIDQFIEKPFSRAALQAVFLLLDRKNTCKHQKRKP